MQEIYKSNFDDIIQSEVKPVFVMFHSDCVDCRYMENLIKDLEKNFDDIEFYIYETKTHDRVTKKYDVNKMPHFSVFVEGMKMVDFRGVVDINQIRSYLDSLLFTIF